MNQRITRLLFAALLAGPVFARAAEDIVTLDKFAVEERAKDPFSVVPDGQTESVFGLAQSVLDTPRSLSVISSEMLERYDVTTINDLVAIAPGTFTSSFYGIAGQIDVRGTPGETYFRGMKRIENPGNYPTPIAASDRIDIVRGPPSPIYGPGKVGGYLNFEPKSARARTGRYLADMTGATKVTFGSWDKRIVSAEAGGPGQIMGKRAGYYGYVMLENSGSYYNNGFQDQFIVQTTVDVDLTPTVRIEFGEMYHYWNGTENAGWNRVTQDLIDNGNYQAGTAAINADINGDGAISPAEMTAVGGLTTTWVYGTPAPKLGPQYALDPATVRTVKLDGSQVLIDSIDNGESDSFGFFFDVIADPRPDFKISNKFFVDYLDRYKHASYGFSQKQEAFSLENKIVAEHKLQLLPWLRMDNAYTASVRFYDVEARADSIFELGNRRDLTVGATPNDRSWLSYYAPNLNAWGSNVQSTYTDVGFGALSNLHIADKWHLLAGVRSDFFKFDSENALGIRTLPGAKGSARKEPIGYSASLTYDLTAGLKPYATYALQPTPLMGQAGEVTVPSVNARPLYDSELREFGFKFASADGKLYASTAAYRQNRSSFDVRTNTITATRSEGIEAELRYVPVKEFTLTGAATFQKTVFVPLGSRTVFTSPIFTGNDPALANAGTLRATLPASLFFVERPGQPDRVFSLYGTYLLGKFGFTLGSIYTASVPSGSSQLIILPDSLVWNGNITFDSGPWSLKVAVNNITDERYFRSLSPDSFGDFTVLPQLPINYQVSVGYKF